MIWAILALLSFGMTFVNSDQSNSLYLPEAQHNISSISCIVKFCEKYFRSEKRVIGSLVIVNVQNTTEFHSQLITMLNEHANYDLGVMTKDATKKHGNPLHVVDKAKNYFVLFNRTSEVTGAINQWHKLPTWNPLAQVVALFINTYEENELATKMLSISREFLRNRMINVNIISYRLNENVVQSHTFYPYDGDNCAEDVYELELIEQCKYVDEENFEAKIDVINPLRLKIPNDLHGCEMHIASSVVEPFVFYDTLDNSFQIGTEVLMVRTIAQSLKMTPVFKRINETRENRIVSNETGIYSMLLKQSADVLIGGMDNDARVQKILWISIPYIQDDQTWCVATARPQELWRNIFSIYTNATWAIIVGTIFFNAFVIYLLIQVENRRENYIWTFMVGISSTLGQYVAYEPQRISIRVMLIFLLMYGMVMCSSFNSFLISILTRPRFKQQVDSLELAIKSNFRFMGGEVALSHYLSNDHISTMVRDNFKICENIDKCMMALEHDEKLTVAVSRLHAMNIPVISQSRIFCFARSNNIYSYSVAMNIKIDYHLMPIINYNIRQLFEFGLIERWHKLSQSVAANEEIKKVLASAGGGEGSSLTVLTVGHIMGAILIMIAGHTTSLLAFIAETIVAQRTKNPNCAKVWLVLNYYLKPE